MSFPTPPNRDESKSTTTNPGGDTNRSTPTPTKTTEPSFGDNMNKHELKRAIENYQEWVAEYYPLEIDLEDIPVEVSNRMKRTAGKVTHRRGSSRVKYIRYAWKAYQHWGWNKFASTIRHELIHVHTVQNHSKGGHGPLFKRMVPNLDTTRYCETFAKDEAKYILYCTECDSEVARRFQRSKTVKHPGRYRSKCCRAPLRVENA